jgi:hypothetical protein
MPSKHEVAGSSPARGIGVQRPVAGVVWTVVSKLNFERSGETGDYAAKRPHLGEWGLPFYSAVSLAVAGVFRLLVLRIRNRQRWN